MIALLLSGCVVLDGFVHNNIHCSTVSTDTCEETQWDPEWDGICLSCDEPYDWARDYAWIGDTVAAGETVRPVEVGQVTPVTLSTDDGLGELDLYWFYSHGENPTLSDLTVIYSHGNYASLEHYAPRVRFLVEAGFNVVAWDYRGYGKSMPETAPSTEQFMADARQVRDYVTDQGVLDHQVVVYAYSLGGIPSTEMVLDRTACALIWETGFTGIGPMTTANTGTTYGGSMLATGGLENTERLKGYTGPLFVMIGTEDHVFSVDDEHQIYENATGPKEFWEVQGAHHGIADVGIPEHVGLNTYFGRLENFLVDSADGCAPR